MTNLHALLPTMLLVIGSATAASSQMPTTQPTFLTIVREEVKVGHGAAHAAHEAGWPAAFARAKSPDYYLALVSMTGPAEAWYVAPYASQSALGESMKRDDANATLSAELQRLSKADADHISSLRVIHAVAAPDLSHGAFPDVALQRFWEITTFRVRPGHEAAFAAAAKSYAAAAKRSNANMSWRTYRVVAGLPSPTYLVFSSVRSFGEFDQDLKAGEMLMAAFTAEELAALEKFSATGLINTESNRFQLDPRQSYVDAETKAKDPAFWNPTKASMRPGEQP